jgi:hypothetical protein
MVTRIAALQGGTLIACFPGLKPWADGQSPFGGKNHFTLYRIDIS